MHRPHAVASPLQICACRAPGWPRLDRSRLARNQVSYKDAHPGAIGKSYEAIYKDVRRAVDLCHCDGVIKDAVAVNPAKYIKADPELPRMLTQLRQGGKQVPQRDAIGSFPLVKLHRPPLTLLAAALSRRCLLPICHRQVFVVTNSLFDYTDVVCRHLMGTNWLDYFDLVICGARKPGFLLDPYLPIFQVRGAMAPVGIRGVLSPLRRLLVRLLTFSAHRTCIRSVQMAR